MFPMTAKRLPGYASEPASARNLDRRPGLGQQRQRQEKPSRLAALNAASEASTSRFLSQVAIAAAIALAFGFFADQLFFGGTYMRLVRDIFAQACAVLGFHF